MTPAQLINGDRWSLMTEKSDNLRMDFEFDDYKDPVIEAYKKDVDRTLIRENLRLTPEQRLRKLMELQRFAEELRRAGREAKKEKI